MSEVEALSVQFSLFPVASGSARASEIFENVFGDEADEVQTNKNVTPQKNFLSFAKSEVKGEARSVRVVPGRVDVQITPVERVDSPEVFPTVDAADSLELLLSGMANMPNDKLEYLRLAVVCHVAQREADLASANSSIARLAGLQAPSPDSMDVMVQMNRRKKIGEDVDINRVLQYSCLQFQSGQYHVVDGQFKPASVVESFASSVNLDFNTVPGNYLITSEGILPIFSDIVELIQQALGDLQLSSILEIEGGA